MLERHSFSFLALLSPSLLFIYLPSSCSISWGKKNGVWQRAGPFKVALPISIQDPDLHIRRVVWHYRGFNVWFIFKLAWERETVTIKSIAFKNIWKFFKAKFKTSLLSVNIHNYHIYFTVVENFSDMEILKSTIYYITQLTIKV